MNLCQWRLFVLLGWNTLANNLGHWRRTAFSLIMGVRLNSMIWWIFWANCCAVSKPYIYRVAKKCPCCNPISFCSLRNHTRVLLYLSYDTKNTEKLLLILEFRTPNSRWRYADVATTSCRPVQQYAWRHWDSAMTLTQQRKSVCHICCIWYFYTTPDTTARLPDSMGQFFYEIYLVGDGARSRMNFARKGILVCAC
jgi:hypothetical protein